MSRVRVSSSARRTLSEASSSGCQHGGVAERRGSGLQSRIRGFESRPHLGEYPDFRFAPDFRAIGAAVARFPDTEEVTGSIPVSPTERLHGLSCGRSSVGRAPPCQGGCREFESRRPLSSSLRDSLRQKRSPWAIGAAVARFPDTEEVTGSIPVSPTPHGASRGAVSRIRPSPPARFRATGASLPRLATFR